jgi:hypothetical protein
MLSLCEYNYPDYAKEKENLDCGVTGNAPSLFFFVGSYQCLQQACSLFLQI